MVDGGPLAYWPDLMGSGHRSQHNKKKKKKQLQTTELKVMMDCDGCELKVKKALSSLDGVKSVEINRKQQKVTVIGYVEANKVLKKAKSTGKNAEIWPYVPYSMVTHPYVSAAYDKKAPPGYVRRVENSAATGTVTLYEDTYMTTIFSDENPNACSIITYELCDVSTKLVGIYRETESSATGNGPGPIKCNNQRTSNPTVDTPVRTIVRKLR
ncbi:hypothetical protein VNO77_43893 [Canavalia gladiata]|uniref:HMA domain-containing protein n=1 Tax=Canavalia gladiata TaxID=3824 RepID=A0AAN9JYL5_CANGL